jgi:hypothetical protein
MARVPRIAGDAEGGRFGHQPQPMFGRGAGGDRNEPGGKIALGHHRVEVGSESRNAAAGVRRHALDGDAEVLQRKRHAGQRQRAVDGLRPRPRRLVERFGDGVDIRPGGFGARDCSIDKVLRRDLALVHQLCEAGCIVVPQHPLGRHCRSPFRRRLTTACFLGN